eukprot:1143818-Pelagomonas_calceolata.AAC.9
MPIKGATKNEKRIAFSSQGETLHVLSTAALTDMLAKSEALGELERLNVQSEDDRRIKIKPGSNQST